MILWNISTRGVTGGTRSREGVMMSISISVNLPPDVEERLRVEYPDLSAAVREGFAVELFRRGILTHFDLGRVLGLDRFETDALLKRHQVAEYSPAHEDVDADVESLKELLGPTRP
jgi:predicted HTH domain antitoxin